MTNPVDLTNLREITDGDVEMERELFNEFIETCDSYIENLSSLTEDSQSEEWRQISHALKGIAINLGANNLGEICKNAQERSTSSYDEKSKMLEDIKDEYGGVKNFLNSLLLG